MHFWSKLSFNQDRVYLIQVLRMYSQKHIYCGAKFYNGPLTQKLKITAQSHGIRGQKFCFFFYILGYLVSSALGQWPQILHTSHQAPGTPSCKIFGYVTKANENFSLKMPNNDHRMQKMCFFGYICQSICLTIIRICM